MSPTPLLLLVLLFAAGDAAAHVVAPGTPLSAVLHHPAFEPAHALAFIGAGLWAGQQAGRVAWSWIGALVAGVVLGVVLGTLLWLPPWRTPALFAGVAVFGTAAALRWRPPPFLGAAICACVGIYQGVVGSIPEYMGGSGHNPPPDIVVAALLLSVLAREISGRASAEWARILVRIAGSWIAAAGFLLLAFTLKIHLGMGSRP